MQPTELVWIYAAEFVNVLGQSVKFETQESPQRIGVVIGHPL